MLNDLSKICLISDLDGTLLPHSKVISQIDIDAINKFTELGGNFSIATGRPFQAVLHYFKDLKITFPAILYNGSMIYDTNNSKIVWKKYLPDSAREIVREVLNAFPHASAEILTFDEIYVIQKNQTSDYHIGISKTNPKVCNLDEVNDGWLKVLFAVEPDKLSEIIDFISKKDYENVEFVQSCRFFYEVLPKNISKGTALEILKETCELNDKKIIAVGDFNNDIEMLKLADIGIATENANQDVKNIANLVLEESCENNAIAKVIELIFTQNNILSNI